MKKVYVGMLSAMLSMSVLGMAQEPPDTASGVPSRNMATGGSSVVPPVIQFSDVATGEGGGKLLAGTVEITFLLYNNFQGGEPLWSETQNVTLENSGHYSVYLGISKPDGVPMSMFTSGEAHWLGVQIAGQAEQPRVFLVSVPYAMKAGDAATLGGLPPSAFALAAPSNAASSTASRTSATSAKSNSATRPDVSGTGTTDYIPLWTNGTGGLGNSAIVQGSDQTIGIGTIASPAVQLSINTSLTSGVSAAVTSTSGRTFGVEGRSDSSNGVGVYGFGDAPSGNTTGVYGASLSPTGNGVFGSNLSHSGSTAGVEGTSASPEGIGVAGVVASTSGDTVGVEGKSASSTGVGVLGLVSSTSGLTDGVVGSTASSTGTGVVGLSSSTSGITYGVVGSSESPEGYGVYGNNTSASGETFGVEGKSASSSGIGVLGQATSASGVTYGVYGHNASSSGAGVLGLSSSTSGETYGVTGTSDSSAGAGVRGTATSASGDAFGVEGKSASLGGTGVLGTATSTSGDNYGVFGSTSSPSGVGVYAMGVASSAEGDLVPNRPLGAWGDTAAPGGAIGVLGTADDGIGMVAANNSPTGYATLGALSHESANANGQVFVVQNIPFGGNCVIDASGNLGCNGTVQAVVPLADGHKAALYAVEAPENWFEDAGSGKLSNGMATVSLDLAFAETVNAAIEYHVFLTPQGECEGLYVGAKTPQGFEVRELHKGHSDVSFDYRIIAHRKGYEAVRLADVTKQMSPLVLGSSKH